MSMLVSYKLSAARTLTALVILVITAAIYWLGLSGPLLLDDHTVLEGVHQWLAGSRSWLSALLPDSDSIIFSRPVAMASLMASAWLGDGAVFAHKLSNLILHLSCGLLGWILVRRLLRLDSCLAPYANSAAIASLAIWLLHPLHVSTVLYVVQRMAQLATLFVLAAVIVYTIGRQQLSDGRQRPALLNLFITFPLLLALGLLSKQNAAVAPLLCFVLEIAYFQHRRPREIWAFFTAFLALPALATAALLFFSPDRLLSGYADWDFTPTQRLLTQPRVLFDYIGMWLIPRGPQMGLYTDAYPISTSLISPPTTALAILALAAISTFVIALRKRHPTIFAGWFFFLGAHAVESTFLPLEMYYEHRNYLPSIGLLLAAIGCGPLIGSAIKKLTWRPRAAVYLVIATVAVLAFSTLGRVIVWQDEATIVAQGVRQHPDSLRARLDSTSLAMRRANWELAVLALKPLSNSEQPRDRFIGSTMIPLLDCVRTKKVSRTNLHTAMANPPPVVTPYDLFMVEVIQQISSRKLCPDISDFELGNILSNLLDAADQQPESSTSKNSTRRITASIYARERHWAQAHYHAHKAWTSNRNIQNGTTLAYVYAHDGNAAAALDMLPELRAMAAQDAKDWAIHLDFIEDRAQEAVKTRVRAGIAN